MPLTLHLKSKETMGLNPVPSHPKNVEFRDGMGLMLGNGMEEEKEGQSLFIREINDSHIDHVLAMAPLSACNMNRKLHRITASQNCC